MATWRIIYFTKNGLVLPVPACSTFKEILSNLRKFHLSFKEMCKIESESPVSESGWSCVSASSTMLIFF